MKEERVLGYFPNLGRGGIIGFSIILTEGRILVEDRGKKALRIWAGLILSAVIWLLVFIILVPLMLAINPALPILGLVLVVPFLLLGGSVAKRLGGRGTIIRMFREQVSRIEYRTPRKLTSKGRFTIRTRKGNVIRFWTAGKQKFEEVRAAVESFCSITPPILSLELAPQRIGWEDWPLVIIMSALGLLTVLSMVFLFLR